MEIEIKEVKIPNNNTNTNTKIKISKEISNMYLNKIKVLNKIDIYTISDINIINCLIGIYYKNGIILKTLIEKNNKNDKNNNETISSSSAYYICNKIDGVSVQKIEDHFITPENVINKINNLLTNCNNFMNLIEINSDIMNDIDKQLIIIQNKTRIENKLDYIHNYRKILLLRDLIHFIRADMFNDINYIYLQALTLKYDFIDTTSIDILIGKFIKLEELEKDYNRIRIPYCFNDKETKIKKIEFNLDNGYIDIINLIDTIIKTIDDKDKKYCYEIKFI